MIQAYVHMESQEGKNEMIPSHLLVFFELKEDPVQDIWLNGSIINQKGIYAYIHPGHSHLKDEGFPLYPGTHNDEGTRAHTHQKLIHWIPKSHKKADGDWVRADKDNPPSPMAVLVGTISCPCLAVPDILAEQGDQPTDFFILKPVNTWGSLFEDEAKEFLSKRNA